MHQLVSKTRKDYKYFARKLRKRHGQDRTSDLFFLVARQSYDYFVQENPKRTQRRRPALIKSENYFQIPLDKSGTFRFFDLVVN